MHDQRMRQRTPLELEYAPQGRRMAGMRAEPVDGLGRKNHEVPVPQRLHGGVEFELRRPYHSYHGVQLYRPGPAQTALFERVSLPAHTRPVKFIGGPIMPVQLQSDDFRGAVPA
jgi:hypothetical protein